MHESICGFVEAVAEQIRWKKARSGLTEELMTHLLEQKEACLSAGMASDEAEREAVRQMGDPVAIGAELDRIHRPRPQWGLLIFAGMLLLAGVVVDRMLRVAEITPMAFAQGSVQRILPGVMALMGGYWLDVSFVGKRIKYLIPLFLLGTILLFQVTPQVNGAYWMVRQVMLLFPVLLAVLIWSQRGKGWRGAMLSLAGAGVGLFVACMIPSSFTCLLVLLSALILGLFFTWRDWFGVGKKLGVGLTLFIAMSALGIFLGGSWERIQITFLPELEPMGRGYFASVIRRALSCAQWLGPANTTEWEAAAGLPLEKLVPELFEDALLVNLICRFGWLPFVLLMLAFAGFFLWTIWKTVRLRQSLGRSVSLAVLTTLLVQCASALLLTFGLPLTAGSFPLVVGNLLSVLNMFLIGIMLSAFRDGAMPEAQPMTGKHPRYKLTVKLERV